MHRATLVFFISLIALVLSSQASLSASPPIKNVMFIVADDLKASVLGCYGDDVCHTPNIDKLAESGMLFQRAYCQGVSCAPSRKSFMFSRYRDTQSVNMGQHFRENGWYSARVGKIYHMRVPGDIIAGTDGLDVASSWTERFNSPGKEAHTPGDYACLNLNIFTDSLQNRESTRMKNRMFVTVQYEGDGSDQPDHKSATKAIELLRSHQHAPFFLAVGFIRPHYPMVQPKKYFDRYPLQKLNVPSTPENDLDDIPKLGRAGTNSATNPIGKYPDNQKRMWQGYYASVEFMDEQVGRVIDELDRLGLRQSTAVVFTSDHGYHLGEHGFWQKSNLHEEVLRIPLIIDAPGFTAGKSDSIVELVDIYPTLADLAGISVESSSGSSIQGTSLRPILRDPKSTVKLAALSFHNGFSYRTDRWHYMAYNDGTSELYDMDNDPNEFTNLALDPTHAQTRDELDMQLRARLMKFDIDDKPKKQKKQQAQKKQQPNKKD